MRQRALSSFLTCFSILLGMALATSIMVVGNSGSSVFAQTDYGYDLLVGPKASPLQLVLNTVYHVDQSPGNIPYELYDNMVSGQEKTVAGKTNPYRGLVEWAVPYAVGDTYKGRRIVGTTPQLFGVDDNGQPLPPQKMPSYRSGEHYAIAEGRVFHPRKFEAVIGSDAARATGLRVGAIFHATHGNPGPNDVPDIHEETWTVVGILKPTHTANDRVLFIPLTSFYAISEHESGLEEINKLKEQAGVKEKSTQPAPPAAAENPEEKAYTFNPDGTINLKLPRDQWEISAILVQPKSPATMVLLQSILRNLPDAIAVNPATVMGEFFSRFMSGPFQMLILISAMVTIVGAVSILVSIYNSVAGRSKEIAIMRALGATRQKILAIVCLEAGIIGTLGGILGLIAGHALAAAGSVYLRALLGTGIPWWHFWWSYEGLYLIVVILVSLLAGLVPALKAYKTPVAENLVGS